MFGKNKSNTSNSSISSSPSSRTGSGINMIGTGGGGMWNNAMMPASSSHPLSLCADCGSSDAIWASVNRGVLICHDCCSVHRSLGRHLSHIKCMKAQQWIPEQFTMVQSLYSCGANSIWEYSLLNPSSAKRTKKPQISDPLHPTKSDFITQKYQNLSFVYRQAKDEPPVTESDLSRQLHSSVRTPNLETSLRLLSQGADPNYYHPEKNSTPLQVAARAGQACQVELLLVYGADPGAVDKMGRSASEYARQSGHGGLANRIETSTFELSDRLSFFLCGKRPDHANGQHFLVPEFEDEVGDQQAKVDARKVAKRKLQGLNNAVFEELAMDVYDEVDRRETDLVWASTVPKSSTAVILPFLPVNPDYGTTRNQGRQKLARLDAKEFAVLVRDVLKEIRRRQTDMSKPFSNSKLSSPLREGPIGMMRGNAKVVQTKSLPVGKVIQSNLSDDEPIYDHVASDDDYYHIPETPSSEDKSDAKRPHSSSGGGGALSRQETLTSTTSSPAKSNNSSNSNFGRHLLASSSGNAVSIHPSEYHELKTQLENSEIKVQRLLESNDDMRSEITRLSMTVSKLVNENEQMRISMSPTHVTSYNTAQPPVTAASAGNLIRGGGEGSVPYADSPTHGGVPQRGAVGGAGNSLSMYEQSSGPTSIPGSSFMTLQTRYPAGGGGTKPEQQFYNTPYGFESNNQSQQQSNSLPYNLGSPSPQQQQQQQQQQQHEYAEPRELSQPRSVSSGGGSQLPSQEEVVRRTEAITRCIQELLISAKDEKFDAFIPCSERIVRAVTDMVVLFPEDEPLDAAVSGSLSSLTAAATHFETECRILIVRSQNEPLQQSFVTQQVIQCAFDIAKSTKQLVALFQ